MAGVTDGGRVIRVLLAWTGQADHDLEARAFAGTLRDSGMDVVFAGRQPSLDSLVRAVIQEDVDVLGVLGGAGDIETALKAGGADTVSVIVLKKDDDVVATVQEAVRRGRGGKGV